MTQWWIVYCPGKKVARSSRSAGLKEELTKFPWIIRWDQFQSADRPCILSQIYVLYVLCRYGCHIVPNGWKRGIVNGWHFTTFHNYCSSTIDQIPQVQS